MTDERSASDDSVERPESGHRAGFGARLAAEREQRALSQADVARALNLRVAVVVAIEEENFAALPKLAFVRGYARTYARLLDVPETEIAEALAAWRDPSEDGRLPLSPASVTPKRGLGRSLHGHAGLILTLLSILVAVFLAAVLLMIWPEGGFTSPHSESAVEPPVSLPTARALPGSAPIEEMKGMEATEETQAMREEGPAASDPVAVAVQREEVFADEGSEGSGAAEEATQLLRQGAPRESALPVANAGPADPGAFAVRRETADDGRVLRVFAEGEDLVQLRFGGDCWVEIRDAEGRGVVSDLAREGQTFEVYGQGPFRLLLGYAHGVQLAYNGEQIPLSPHIRNDIASLVVGR